MSVAIKAEGLSKAYQLGEFSTGTLSQDIERMWYRLRGKEDPFLKIGESNDRTAKGGSNIVWSLRDVNFEIKQGEAVGIIGRNGAGKSTLLKVLSRVTTPTEGSVKIKGRIASLLEVGTGFHPELTGRENIFLNGAILGMRKQEITRKFDEIVAFAGVERYIDTPVKRYSSGMYVRLAFAVAAHLESEILIVDEVLAVGDAEFQKKCLGKMNDLSRNQGRTVLFVSHNMGVIAQLCNAAILLRNGQMMKQADTRTVIEHYLTLGQKVNSYKPADTAGKSMYVSLVETLNDKGSVSDSYHFDEPVSIKIRIGIRDLDKHAKMSLTLQNQIGDYLSTLVEDISTLMKNADDEEIEFCIKYPPGIISPNSYAFRVAVFTPQGSVYDLVEMVCPISIVDNGSKLALFEGINYGSFFLNYAIQK